MHTVFYIFGWIFATLSASFLLPLIFALAAKEFVAAQAFFASTLLTAFVGGGLIFSFVGRNQPMERKYSLLLAGFLWVVAPIPAAMPFIFAGIPGDIVKSYFEAVSGLTTTGASVLSDLSSVPQSILFYRSFLQWIGGLATLLFFGLILAPMTGPDRIDPTLRRIGQTHLGTGKHFKEAANTVFPIYIGLTSVCFILLLLAQIPAFDALCISLSTLSTGGFIPRAGTISLYGSPLAELILAIFMFLGAVSIFWVRGALQLNWASVSRTKEPLYIAAAISLFGLVLAAQLIIISPEQGLRAIYHSLTLGLATAASFISTAGFAISPQTSEIIPYTALILICFVGGGAFSTAGGLKMFRLLAMFEMAAREVNQLIFPHGVQSADKKYVTPTGGIALVLAANFAVVIIAVVFLALILSASELPFSGAILAAVSAISNIGPAFEQAGLPELAGEVFYADLSPISLLFVSAGMILGRVEVLALLTLLNFAYWR